MLYKNIYILFIIINFSFSQVKPTDGLIENPPSVWALINGKIYTDSEKILDSGTIIIRDGHIEKVGKNINIPDDASTIDMSGKIIYPGFIDSWVEADEKSKVIVQHDSHWSSKVNARKKLSQTYLPNNTQLSKLRKLGFTSAHFVPDSGIFQGQTALIQLNKSGTTINSSISQSIDYEVDGWESDDYPSALLGVIALMRQTFIDALWYGEAQQKLNKYPDSNMPIRINEDLEILNEWIINGSPFIFQTNHELRALRSLNIANEFKLNSWIYGSGYEYRRISEISLHKPFIILPLDFPNTPDISNPYQELSYSLSELKHWDMAPDNPSELLNNNIPFAITSNGLKHKEFRKNLLIAIDRGLKESDALSAITTIPADKFGVGSILGKIKPGYLANLTITNGNYFDSNSKVYSVWVNGVEHMVEPQYQNNIEGRWNLTIGNEKYNLEIEQKSSTYSGKMIRDTLEYTLKKLKVEGHFINWQTSMDSTKSPIRFTGHILENRMEGSANDININWNAIKIGSLEKKKKKREKNISANLDLFYPEGAFGKISNYIKEPQTILVKNTTLWTSSDKGVLKNIDILFDDGKVKEIANKIKAPKEAIIINGTGKHVTPGLIDCHSHSAAFSINEGTQSITSEVRIQDVINSDDIAIYRQLAGGLTMANILHGSANTIGGQNAVIKLRWSADPENLLYENATPGIKFALGENVKQSNWGDDYTSRYPQTRMGVEQILRDAFTSAVEYKEELHSFNNNGKKWKKKIPPRRNLELDALAEIIEGERQIHCHSYRQDEILMLARVAEDFGFTVGTFQHVLEGYKVANIIKEHGANASTFSDWWAYKYEVIDAIPFNGTLMANVGVNVSFNSDSNELARRMNTEAAKAVKYGGLSEDEALKFVTINPAIQLGIDKWVGSLELGKDADFVIWSDHPLSTKSACEQTWIDGIQYFSIEKDSVLRLRDSKMRNKLINKILSKKNIDKKQEWKHSEEKSVEHHHCIGHP